MDDFKSHFIQKQALGKLGNELEEDTKAIWGVMSAQHMVEHLAEIFRISIEDHPYGLITPEEDLYKYRRFMLSHRPIKRFANYPGLPPRALADLKFHSIAEALQDLSTKIDAFYQFYNQNPDIRIIHPYFGNLNGWEWEVFHYKHMIHHLTQFGLLPEDYVIVRSEDLDA